MSLLRRAIRHFVVDEPERVEVRERLGAVELTVGLLFMGAGYAGYRLWSFADRARTDAAIVEHELTKLRARLDRLERPATSTAGHEARSFVLRRGFPGSGLLPRKVPVGDLSFIADDERTAVTMSTLAAKDWAAATLYAGASADDPARIVVAAWVKGERVERDPLYDQRDPALKSTPPCYVMPDRSVVVPERILKAIGVTTGGVSFVDKGDGIAEMMSDETLVRLSPFADDVGDCCACGKGCSEVIGE